MTTTSQPNPTPEDLLRGFARLLAPYLAIELKGLLPSEVATEGLSVDYDERTCAVFVRDLGDRVVDRAIVLFEALAQDTMAPQPIRDRAGRVAAGIAG